MKEFIGRFVPVAMSDPALRTFLLDPNEAFPNGVNRLIVRLAGTLDETARNAVRDRFGADPEYALEFMNWGEIGAPSVSARRSPAPSEIARLKQDYQVVLDFYDQLLSLTLQQLEEATTRLTMSSSVLDGVDWGEVEASQARWIRLALADAHLHAGRPYLALETMGGVVGDSRSTAKRLNQPRAFRDVSASLHKVGDSLRHLGRDAEALPLYEESLTLSRELLESQKTPNAARDVGVSLDRVGDALSALGRDAEALPLYEESLKLRRELLDSQKTPKSLRDLGVSYERLALYYNALGDINEARRWFAQELEIGQELVRLQGEIPYARGIRDFALRNLAKLDGEENST